MKKLNSNNRILDDGQAPVLHQHNSGAFTQREISGVGAPHAGGFKSQQPTHGSTN